MAENLSGTIERVTFHNPESGFAVLRVQARGKRGLVTVVGKLPRAVAGEYVEASGAWKQDKEHGMQFQADELRTTPPHTKEGIEKYLASGLVKGIGPHFASRIVEAFGERTLAVIDESPAFLREVKGIGPRRLQLIRDSWQSQKAIRKIMVFLQSHGVGTARAVRIYKTYGDQAIDLVRENPYRLATDIWGIGFKSADEIAEKLQVPRDSPQRARAAVRYVLEELRGEGHCGYPQAGVLERTGKLLEIDPTIVRDAVAYLIAEKEVVREPPGLVEGGTRPGTTDGRGDGAPALRLPDAPWLYLKSLYLAEVGAARGLRSLCQGKHPLPAIDVEVALGWVEKKMNIELAPAQREAIRKSVTSKVLVVTGGPGVGKTTIVRGILEIFAAKKRHCLLCAPTGRAARRLSESTGRPAKTIHRLLEFDPGRGEFRYDQHDPLEADLLVVDEVSMVDLPLMYQLVRAVSPRCCLVLVGDVDQLPSVGPGTVLADVIASGAVPIVRLTEIFRQAQKSTIVRAAHQVNHGEFPHSAPDPNGDFFFIEAAEPDAILDRILTLLRERIPARFRLDPFRDVQVLTPMNRSDLGVRNLNARLQEVLNPYKTGPRIERFGWTYQLGDKVIQTVNDYQKDVFNGDIGRIVAIDPVNQELKVDFEGRGVAYEFDELDELALAYALTIHKSQGSEYPAVIVPLHTQHYLLLQRNLLYTAITRGKKLVVLVGSKKALALAVQRQDTSRRYTALRERLRVGHQG